MAQLPAIIPGNKAKKVYKVRNGFITANNQLHGRLVEADPDRRFPAGCQILTSKIVAVHPHMDGTLTVETRNSIYEVVK